MFKKILSLVAILLLAATAAQAEEMRTIKDMRGKDVTFPQNLTRVATIDDGFVEGVMTHLGVIKSVTMIGSWSMKRDYKYDFETEKGEKYSHSGWNTMKFLHPWLNDVVCVTSAQGYVINYEALAAGDPQLVILRVGDCTVGPNNPDAIDKTIQTIEALGIPLAVIYSPTYYKSSDLSTMVQEGAVIGDIFNQKEKAVALMEFLAETEAMIRQRTAGINDADKPAVAYLGLNPNIRKNGGAGSVHGTDTPESYIVEQVVNARNAFRGTGSGIPISAEQIYAMNPDVIILPTSNGYHPPRELLEAPYFANLRELDAIKNQKVYAMPWSPMNCSRRVEYPIDLLIIAKAAYPDRFSDISVYDFALNFYQKVYHVDEKTAVALRSQQLLDWMKDKSF